MTGSAPYASGRPAEASPDARPRPSFAGPALDGLRRGIDRWASTRYAPPLAEITVSAGVGVGLMLLCTRISVNPIIRIGQVSGLAKVQQYAAFLGIPLLGVLLLTAYRGQLRHYRTAQRLVCAAVAGLGTGIVAGGIAVALHGTPWGLGGQEGDPGNLLGMAVDMMRGRGLPGVYPPLFPGLLAVWAELFHHGSVGVGHALKDLQLLFSALVGPMTYAAWRLLLRPFWAVAVAVPTSIVFLDPIRPYSHGAMLVLLPLLAACFRELRRIGELPARSAVRRGLGFGAAFGVVFLWYSGWFVWAAPGAFVLALLLFPWRRGAAVLRRTALFAGAVLAAAGVIGSPLLYQLVRLGATTTDRYAYIDTYIDPAYVTGWASDRAGLLDYHNWPPAGELAGQTGFGVLLLAGAGLGVGLGLHNTVVRTAGSVLAGAWLLRFWFASHMEANQAVQLYPRTTWIIFYCLLVLAVLGVMLAYERGSGWLRGVLGQTAPDRTVRIAPRATAQLAAGLVCAIALLGVTGGSWSANRYMPSTNATPGIEDMGLDALRAHLLALDDGQCPPYSPNKGKRACSPPNRGLHQYVTAPDEGKLWCGDAWNERDIVCGRSKD